MIVATAGHVDHGKSALVQALTGVDTDRLPEEKARGLSIELGFAYHDLGDGETTGFIDVPGHEKFIRTMVAGVSGIDVVMFIVAADDGPMPQTAEHLAILDLLGVERGIIALTKIDRVEPSRVEQVKAEIEVLVAGTSLASCPVVPVSAHANEGIDTLRKGLLALKAELPAREVSGNFRLAVDRSFLLKGAGRVVTGTVFSGALKVDSQAIHTPGDDEVRIRTIHAQNANASVAEAGQRCALNLVGPTLDDGTISRGDWIVARDAGFTTRRIDCELRALKSESRGLKNRTPVHVHIGAADVTGRVVTFNSKAIAGGETGRAQILLDRDLHCVRGDHVVLRDQSARRTIGGGVVRDPIPDARGRSRPRRLAYLDAMCADTPDEAMSAAMTALPDGVDVERFRRAWNLTADEVAALEQRMQAVKVTDEAATLLFEAERWTSLRDQVPAALKRWHEAHPDRSGANPADLNRELPESLTPQVLSLVVDALLDAKVIEREGGQLRLPRHEAKRSPEDERLWRRVKPLLARPDLKVPVVHDMLAKVDLPLKPFEAFLARSAQQGYVVKVSNKRYFLPESIARCEAMIYRLSDDNPDQVFSVAEFRDVSGIGRNAIIEILEYFDRIGITRRHGQVRKLIKRRELPA